MRVRWLSICVLILLLSGCSVLSWFDSSKDVELEMKADSIMSEIDSMINNLDSGDVILDSLMNDFDTWKE